MTMASCNVWAKTKLTIHDILKDSDPIALTLTSVGGPEGCSSSSLIIKLWLAFPYPIELFARTLTS